MSNFSLDGLTEEQKKLWEDMKSWNLGLPKSQKLSEEQLESFFDLTRRTINLISLFYETPTGQMSVEMRELFINMMAIYEADPTKENAKKIYDVITKFDRYGEPSSKEATAEYKKEWIKNTFESIPEAKRTEALDKAKQKYIDGAQSVPDGIPPSGKLLNELGFVPETEKNLLMEAQAAVRILTHLEVLDDFKVKNSYQKTNGTFEKAHLDKTGEKAPKKIQLLEHIVEMSVNDIFTQYESRRESINKDQNKSYTVEDMKRFTRDACKTNVLLQKARNEALATLERCAKEFKEKNPKASERIATVLTRFDDREQLDKRKQANAKRPDERVTRCLKVLEEASQPLTHDDLKKWSASVAGRPIEGAIAHRADQIIKKDEADKAAEIARQAAIQARARS